MVSEKLQHLITKLSQKLLRVGVFGKSEKVARSHLAVENHYQRTELPAKGEGQWILFRCGNHPLGFNDGHFFMRCDGDVLFSTTMLYRLFLDIPYHRHRCDYFPKPSGSIILQCL